jgi:DNA-binding MarR family transcriptional regulator
MELQSLLLPLYEKHLVEEFGIPLTWYDVLHHLDEAPGGGMRMTDLAGALTFSKSGLTTLVDRMEAADLLERTSDPGDRRATVVRLTEHGRTVTKAAVRAHKAAVQKHFLSRMSATEERSVARVLGRVVDELRAADGAE